MINAIFGALIVGLSLGVFGSGGSILTVPVLLYLVNIPPDIAIASSLLIVGGISLFGSTLNIHKKLISWRHVVLFGLPGMVGTYFGAWFGVIAGSKIQLSVFVILMAIAAKKMWPAKPSTSSENTPNDSLNTLDTQEANAFKVIIIGAIVGVVTGFVGVGGGFLIVPALTLLCRLSMPLAVGTSLLIIALKSFVGFFKYYSVLSAQSLHFDWMLIGLMIVGGTLGSFAGIWLGSRLPKEKLQKAFSIFLVAMSMVVFTQSIL